MTTRKYSSRSQQTTLTSGLTSSGTSATVVSSSGLLGGITISAGETFTVVLDPDTALEEIVDVTAISGNTLTITRGIDGSSGQAHSAGAVVKHRYIGRDAREANQHIENVTAAHGLTIADVVTTTNTKTLTNKTLTSPTINGGTVAGAAVTGLSSPTNGGDAANKTYVDGILGSATSAATSATAAAASASAASTSATNAATSATNAGNSANSAANSASSAAASATTATNQATSASTYSTSAAASASSASTSATTATTKATEASTSATNAASSATSAASSASSASTSAAQAASSATSAAATLVSLNDQAGTGIARDMGSITESDTSSGEWIDLSDTAAAAASSASAAATSASSASTSASNAATSATNASNSASSASTSATNAANSATAAASSATSAAASAVTAASYIPSMTGNNGKFLTTDGTSASWVSISDWGTL